MDEMIDVVGCVPIFDHRVLRFETREKEVERMTSRKREQCYIKYRECNGATAID